MGGGWSDVSHRSTRTHLNVMPIIEEVRAELSEDTLDSDAQIIGACSKAKYLHVHSIGGSLMGRVFARASFCTYYIAGTTSKGSVSLVEGNRWGHDRFEHNASMSNPVL